MSDSRAASGRSARGAVARRPRGRRARGRRRARGQPQRRPVGPRARPRIHHNLRVDVPGTPVADLREAYETARAYGDDDADYSEERGGPVPDGAREFRIRY